MFEWDEAKNLTNFAKHGIGFETADLIFDGPVVTSIDDRFDDGAIRQNSICAIKGAAICPSTSTKNRA